MRTHRILVEFIVEAKDKTAAEASFLNTIKPQDDVKVIDILYVKPCKKEEANGIRKD